MLATTPQCSTAHQSDDQAGMEAARPSIIWIGDGKHPEFAAALAILRAHASVTALYFPSAASLDDVSGDCPVIVVAQAYSGQFRRASIAALRRGFR